MIEILATPFELLRVAQGNPMGFRDSEGNEVTIRIPTADEIVDISIKAAERLGIPHTEESLANLRERAPLLAKPFPYSPGTEGYNL